METLIEKINLTTEISAQAVVLCVVQKGFIELINTITDYLHVNEINYFKKLQFEKRQYNYLLGRYCAKVALTAYLNMYDSTEIEISIGALGQPVVVGSKNLQISISHTNDSASVIVFPELYPMGIDIETCGTKESDAIHTTLTATEKKHLATKGITNGHLLLWTAKEALSKALKCGLTIPLDILEIKEILCINSYYISTFTNFPQYKGISYEIDNKILSIVVPTQIPSDIFILR